MIISNGILYSKMMLLLVVAPDYLLVSIFVLFLWLFLPFVPMFINLEILLVP